MARRSDLELPLEFGEKSSCLLISIHSIAEIGIFRRKIVVQ
jgi:hypothetical protein